VDEMALREHLRATHPREKRSLPVERVHAVSGKVGDDVVNYVTAIANMSGGHLVLGVHDKTLDIVRRYNQGAPIDSSIWPLSPAENLSDKQQWKNWGPPSCIGIRFRTAESAMRGAIGRAGLLVAIRVDFPRCLRSRCREPV
jgi:hypothetical protein